MAVLSAGRLDQISAGWHAASRFGSPAPLDLPPIRFVLLPTSTPSSQKKNCLGHERRRLPTYPSHEATMLTAPPVRRPRSNLPCSKKSLHGACIIPSSPVPASGGADPSKKVANYSKPQSCGRPNSPLLQHHRPAVAAFLTTNCNIHCRRFQQNLSKKVHFKP